MSQLKTGFERIKQHLDYLSNQFLQEASGRYWPYYLFHFTDICNAANILKRECLLSREQVQKTEELVTDIASPEIIDTTPPKWKQFVRLYFRPRTPMLFSNEGIRPKDKLEYGAHCPVPVFFLFDAGEILMQQSTKFSDGNLRAVEASVDNSVDFFQSLPFDKIYHDSSLSRYSDIEKKEIIFHRHAEVIVPGRLRLSALKYIYCRSQAELETLLHLLPVDKRGKWRSKVRVNTKSPLFFFRWSYIDRAFLSPSFIVFYFNSSEFSTPFHARIELKNLKTGEQYLPWEEKRFSTEIPLILEIAHLQMEQPLHYKVSFFLDNHLAYCNEYNAEFEMLF